MLPERLEQVPERALAQELVQARGPGLELAEALGWVPEQGRALELAPVLVQARGPGLEQEQ